MDIRQRVYPYLERLFGIDVRTLALLRIMLGFVTVFGTVVLWTQLDVFFTDDGIIPRYLAVRSGNYNLFPAWFSLLFTSGEAWFVHLYFAFTCLCGFGLMVGYRSRLMCFLCWLLTTSIISRISQVVVGCDMQLKVIFFWSMFLPLGEWASVDRLRKAVRPSQPFIYLSFASAGLLLQVLYLYLFGGLFKTTGIDWDESGLALYYALNIAQHSSIFAQPLLAIGMPYIVWLNFFVLYLEIFVFALLFSPLWTYPLRLVGQLLLVGLHLGFLVFLSIGIFPLVSITGLAAFTSPMVWNWLGRRTYLAPLKRGGHAALTWLDRRLPATPHPAERGRLQVRVRESALAILVALVLWQNIAVIPFTQVSMPNPVKWLLSHIGLYQHWGVYAPNVPHRSDWFTIEGKLHNGRVVDAYRRTGEVPSAKRPVSGYSAHPYPRWLYYMMRARWSSHGPYFGRYLCQRWNQSAEQQEYGTMQELRIYHHWQDTPMPGYAPSPAEQRLVYTYRCRRN
jgi:hypothetical protein